MKELSTQEIQEVSGGITRFVAAYLGTKVIDAYLGYAMNPSPLFTDTDATLEYGNASGMY